jgi:hypothetical protein
VEATRKAVTFILGLTFKDGAVPFTNPSVASVELLDRSGFRAVRQENSR